MTNVYYPPYGWCRKHSDYHHKDVPCRYSLGQTVTLPDGPTGRIVRIEYDVEYGEPALYLTVISSLGNEVTRWVRR